MLCDARKVHGTSKACHQEDPIIWSKACCLNALKAYKKVFKASTSGTHKLLRLLAENAKFHQKLLNRLIRPDIRNEAVHLREDAVKGVRLEIIPESLQHQLHITTRHQCIATRIVHAHLTRRWVHVQN